MCDQKVWSSAEKTSVPCGTTAGLCERCDLYDAADSDAARITALEAQLAAAEARADKAEGFRDGCTSTDPCGGCARCVTETLGWRDAAWAERDALRADLARVTAEREVERGQVAVRDQTIRDLTGHHLDACAMLAAARQEAEGLRAALKKALRHTQEHADGCLHCGEGEIVNGTTTPEHRAACWYYRAERLADAALPPAPVPATPVSAIHNVGKPCPVCSGCDVCLGTGRAPHYVPAPVPATPAPDALALLREARHALDSAWSLRPSVDVELVPTAFRPLSVRTLFAKIDAALTGRA